jgi:hypothetical protein
MPVSVRRYSAGSKPEYKQLCVRIPVTAYLDLLNIATALQRKRRCRVSTVAAVVECIAMAGKSTMVWPDGTISHA